MLSLAYNNVLFTHPSDSSNMIRCFGLRVTAWAKGWYLYFSPKLLPPCTHTPPLILYPPPPGAPLHCCSVSGWSLSPVGSRHFPHQRNQSTHRKCTALFSHPKNIGIASLLQLVWNCFFTSPSFNAHDNNNILYVLYRCCPSGNCSGEIPF